MAKGVAEVLEEVSKTRSSNEKAEILKKNSSKALKDVLGYALNPYIKWLLPVGDVPYKPLSKESDAQATLLRETKLFPNFVAMAGKPLRNLTKIKREALFIQLLESLDPDDAKLMVMIKDKKLPKGVTESAVRKAFPKLFENWENE